MEHAMGERRTREMDIEGPRQKVCSVEKCDSSTDVAEGSTRSSCSTVKQPEQKNLLTLGIVGGGPCGMIMYKVARDSGKYSQITLFEKGERIGGLWNP